MKRIPKIGEKLITIIDGRPTEVVMRERWANGNFAATIIVTDDRGRAYELHKEDVIRPNDELSNPR